MFSNFYAGKRILVTGHTGFKGSWLCLWLSRLGANVYGYAWNPPTDPSHFYACQMNNHVHHREGDIRDFSTVLEFFQFARPDCVFHLAAQALVRDAYHDPVRTFDINVMGTVNVLEAARQTSSVKGVVVVTSDKCYRNQEWPWGYRETDPLGGEDPYSGSKACAELVTAVYQASKFQQSMGTSRYVPIASVRAGNVIGGGDWAKDRLIPDLVRTWRNSQELHIRYPHAIRPWQHVLEPLSGYLWLGVMLARHGAEFATGWNFGPPASHAVTVRQVVNRIREIWDTLDPRITLAEPPSVSENLFLQLDSSKAHRALQWKGIWNFEQTIQATLEWYRRYYHTPNSSMADYSWSQIEEYAALAQQKGLAWASDS